MHGRYTRKFWSGRVLPVINHSQEMAADLWGKISASRWTGSAEMVSVSLPTVAEVMPLPLSRLMVTTGLLILGTARHEQSENLGSKLMKSQTRESGPKECPAVFCCWRFPAASFLRRRCCNCCNSRSGHYDFRVNGLRRLGAAWISNNCTRMTA